MNHSWTVTLILLSATFASTQYFGEPIQCWCPAEFKKWQRRYVRQYCWVSNTYRHQMSDAIPMDEELHMKAELSYYQWVPIILLGQAFMFKLPYILWHLMNPACGLNLSRLCKFIDQLQAESVEDKNQSINGISLYLDRWLVTHRAYNKSMSTRLKRLFSRMFLFCCGQRFGIFLSGLYLCTKLIYLGNCGFQLWMMNSFLGVDMWSYGMEIVECIFGNTCKPPSGMQRFPRVTLCDFKIRQMQNIQPYTVQCVLPINIFYEKIYLILWTWIWFVAVLTFISLLIWLKFMFIRRSRQSFVRKYLTNEIETKADIKLVRSFADKYLRHDGCFLMRVVQRNTSDVTVKDLVCRMWEVYTQPVIKETSEDAIDVPKEEIK